MFFKSLVFSKTKISLGGFFFEKKPMTNKIKKFLYTLEHLIPDAHEEIPTFAFYHPLLLLVNCQNDPVGLSYTNSNGTGLKHCTVGDAFTEHGVIGKIFVAKNYLVTPSVVRLQKLLMG